MYICAWSCQFWEARYIEITERLIAWYLFVILQLKVLLQKKHSLLKPKPIMFAHDIIIGRSMNDNTPRMKKSSSNVSIGRASIKRRRGTGTPLHEMFGKF